jgi:hypothetical protein
LLKGLQVGLEFFRNRKHASGNSEPIRTEAEEELFI